MKLIDSADTVSIFLDKHNVYHVVDDFKIIARFVVEKDGTVDRKWSNDYDKKLDSFVVKSISNYLGAK